jgi:hypothetical protein
MRLDMDYEILETNVVFPAMEITTPDITKTSWVMLIALEESCKNPRFTLFTSRFCSCEVF